MSFKDTHEKALKAYLDVWSQGDIGWSPPPSDMLDKKWSRILRSAWLDFTRIEVSPETAKNQFFEMRLWCEKQSSGHWCNGAGNIWFFEKKDIAVLFKLTFGGDQK